MWGKEIPDDIPAFIREVQPSIEVGDDGFATLTLDERILHEDNSPSGSEQRETLILSARVLHFRI